MATAVTDADSVADAIVLDHSAGVNVIKIKITSTRALGTVGIEPNG